MFDFRFQIYYTQMCCEGWFAKGISPVQVNGSNLIGEFARDVRKLKII